MKLIFLGTGDVRQVPVYGCKCDACQAARADARLRRRPCSALLDTGRHRILIDGGLTDLAERFAPGDLAAILLTHYHVDHVQGLFHLRWGVNDSIPVYGPDDHNGCADLLKHPGILDFRPPLTPLMPFTLGDVEITPLPLQHSKPTFGYLFELKGQRIAYLTDTVGLPENTEAFLAQFDELEIVIDCSQPPQTQPPRNHNDLNLVLAIHQRLQPKQTWLTHLSHDMDAWLMTHKLPTGVRVARDGLVMGCP
ncbi:5-phospho-alpha-D-ribosyl 1,2-cyclic phosphate phosphodiesterase [Marinobacterium halophilum]|uniref:5-phospho-alpha-D-ribosyl 1,2-cyclic phosphate phosphodiesterase n=1 Tax=Marinobacterium halophilum TaxID=267374 RepID=A0A2P8F3D8_9GAMM|nr:phosphonate metabolism protein PhnP [Marinobacterium halophilum]PSL16232.1 5-phospho-alpha-D-ribosyl 1,2-cyclic phosphate phosphodiesterase [Marinobacterium halophilum]